MNDPTPQTVRKQTPDLAGEQIARLRTLFPECVSEGRIDFDRLRIKCARRHLGAI